MPASDQTVKVTLVAVATPLVKGMGEASGAATKLGKDLDGAGAKAKGMESGLAGSSAALKGMAAGAAAVAGTALVAFMRDAVTEAGNLEQSVGGVDAVFGSSAKTIHDFGQGASEAVGLSRNAFNELATVTGALLKNSGIKDFSNETLRLTERAADVSATFGGTAREAVESFNAALKGEYNPIEKYGVKLSEAAVNAALAAKGLDGLKGAALEQAKAQERVNLIMAQTADHAGRFASEANTLQGQQQRLTAAWQDAKAELGQSLLPVLTRSAEAMKDGVSAVVAAASAWNELPGPVQSAVVAMSALVLLRGPLNGAIGGLVTLGGQARSVVSGLSEALGYAAESAARAGGGLRGAAAGVQTFAGGIPKVKLSAADAAIAVVAVAAAANELAQAIDQANKVDPSGLANSLARLGAEAESANNGLGKLFQTSGLMAKDLQSGKDALDAFALSAQVALGNNFGDQIDRLTSFGTAGKKFDEQVRQMDAALAQMVSSGNAQGAIDAYERLMAAAARANAEGANIPIDEIAGKFTVYRGALDNAAGGNTGLEGSALESAAAVKQQEDALAKTQQALDKYIQSLVSAGLAVLSTRDATRNMLDALADVDAQIAKNGTTLDINTAAGRENQAVLDGIARNALNLADAIYKETGSEEAFRGSLAASRDSLVQTGIRFGMSQAQAEAYADSILRIPTSKHTNITTNAASAIGDVDRLQQRINSLRGNTIDIGVRYVDLNANPTSKAGGITRAAGGPVWGPGTTTSDSIPAWLSNGEYVVKAAAVAKYGLHFMDRVNSMRLASGGSVGAGSRGGDSAPLDPAAIRAALDGATLRLGPVDSITREVAATLLTAHSRSV